MKTTLMALVAFAQLAMPLSARADDDYLKQLGNIAKHEELLQESKKWDAALNAILANNAGINERLKSLRAEEAAAEKECDETCKGPATRETLASVRQLSEVALAGSSTLLAVRLAMAKYAKSKAVQGTEAASIVSSRFKLFSLAAIGAAGASAYISYRYEKYMNLHDQASIEQLTSIRAQVAADQKNLDDSNVNVRRIIAAQEGITAALQVDSNAVQALAK